MNTLQFRAITNRSLETAHLLSDGNVVLWIEPSLSGWTEETEGEAAIIVQTIGQYFRDSIVDSNGELAYDVLAYGDLDAIEYLYMQAEGHSYIEVSEALQ